MTTVNYLPLRVVERRDAYGFLHYGRRIEEVEGILLISFHVEHSLDLEILSC